MNIHKIKILEKHCTVAREGRVALSNTLVETAVKVHNCPIRVTCTDYPGEECILSVSDLTASVPMTGPHPDQFKPGNTYYLFYYTWKGSPIKTNADPVVVETEELEDIPVSTISRKADGTFVIKTPVVVTTTTYEEKTVTYSTYAGAIIKAKRTELKLHKNQLSAMTNGACSPATIGRIELGDNSTIDTLVAICDALGLYITDLFPPKEDIHDTKN
jgi:hypothetical protein